MDISDAEIYERKQAEVREKLLASTGTAQALARRGLGIVGGRPDGTMGSAPGVERGQALGPLQKTHDAINHIMQNETALRQQLEDANSLNERLEKECILLKRQLDAEHMARASLETTIRQIAEIVVNGSKAPGT